MNQINWKSILQLELNNPNLSLRLLHDNFVYLLDEFPTYRRISKKELIRNSITKLKREAKKRYYKDFFELNKTKISIVWKGIKSIVNIKQQSSRKDITLIDGDGKDITDPYKISNSFNKYFVNIGPDIDKTIPKSKHDYNKYLNEIHMQ